MARLQWGACRIAHMANLGTGGGGMFTHLQFRKRGTA